MGWETTLRWGSVQATAGVVLGGAGAQSQHKSLGWGDAGGAAPESSQLRHSSTDHLTTYVFHVLAGGCGQYRGSQAMTDAHAVTTDEGQHWMDVVLREPLESLTLE